MKTLLMITNMMLAGIIIFISCNKAEPATATATPASARPCPDCYDHTRTSFAGIGTETAIQMSNDYKNLNQPKLIIDEVETDANSIWYSLETLKSFIWKIEQEACRRGCGDRINLGLRLYYGRYPDAARMAANPDLAGLPPSFQQHHTLFMVPTFQDPLDPQIHRDFDPWHWGSSTCTPKSMEQWFAMGSNKPFGAEKSLIFSSSEIQYFRSAGGGGLVAGMNHGNMIPPGNDGGTGY
jgi:hypothetical protein